MIPESVVQQVRDRADIVEIVGEHLTLKRAGKEFKALCPFHNEKTPSFYVVPAKGFFKCFGCGESGDAFSFLMKRQGLGFHDAVKLVADRVGVEIPDAGPERRWDEEHRPVYEALAFAADFFARQLAGEVGAGARAYLEARGIDADAIARFQIGYAPNEWRALREAAGRHGIDDEVLLEAGLTKKSEKSDEAYDRFRDRIIFPIPDTGGRVIAFGGRVLPGAADGAPKYLNSPETPVYHKGRLLYGIYWSRNAIRREEAALVVEGYMDYVSLAARGIENVVAGLGTAMTTEQASLLSRYADKALLLYDSDTAGMRATFRTADALLREGVHPLVVTLPPGEDPDSIARAGGAAALKPYLDAAVDVMERKLRILEEKGYFKDIEGVRKALDGLLPTIRATTDPALRDIYIARVAERTSVRRETLAAEAESAPAPDPTAPAAAHERRPAERPAASRRRPLTPGVAGQRKLALLMLRDAEWIPPAGEQLKPEDFSDDAYREIFSALVAGVELRGEASQTLSEAARERLDELLANREDLMEADRVFADCVRDITREALYARMDELTGLMDVARMQGDAEAETRYLVEKSRIAGSLKSGSHSERLVRKFLQNRRR